MKDQGGPGPEEAANTVASQLVAAVIRLAGSSTWAEGDSSDTAAVRGPVETVSAKTTAPPCRR